MKREVWEGREAEEKDRKRKGESERGGRERMRTFKISLSGGKPHTRKQEVVLVFAVDLRLQGGSDRPVSNTPEMERIPNRSPNKRLLRGRDGLKLYFED